MASDLLRSSSHVVVELPANFRYGHEPFRPESPRSFVGRSNEVDQLARRILFSDGGSYLITGYRGVGKTSFVNRVVGRTREMLPALRKRLGDVRVVDVHVSLARPLAPPELMHYIARHLYERLREMKLLEILPRDLRDEALLAYQRTSVTISTKAAQADERSFGVGDASVSGTILNAAIGGFAWSAKRSRSSERAMTFLGYDDKAAENDIVRITRRLADGFAVAGVTRRLLQRLRLVRDRRLQIKVVFVLDELDKLEQATPDGSATYIDRLLSDLKNLFTTSGITFLFIAGKDLYDRWLSDVGRGDSVYESVFCYDRYLPCMWDATAEICSVDTHDGTANGEALALFVDFLQYRGRGIPRRMLREFNQFVVWPDDATACLAFKPEDVRRFRFYSELRRTLGRLNAFSTPTDDLNSTETDQRRLAILYLVDWILAGRAREFTGEQAIAAIHALSAKIALAADAAAAVVSEVLRILTFGDFLERVDLAESTLTIVPETSGAARYRLTARRVAELSHVAPATQEPSTVTEMPTRMGGYLLGRMLGTGGTATVYEAVNEATGETVALKVLSSDLLRHPDAVVRFRREARVLSVLKHPFIVRHVETVEDGGFIALAMERLEGVTLSDVVRTAAPLQWPLAVMIARRLAEAVAFIHRHGYYRTDLKPSNVLFRPNATPCLIDLGIVTTAEESAESKTRPVFIGTVKYAAPEQFQAMEDERCDIYSFGLVLREMLTGSVGGESNSLHPQTKDAFSESRADMPSELSLPDDIREVVKTCLRTDPAERWQRMEDIIARLDGLLTSEQTDASHATLVQLLATVDVNKRRQDEITAIQPLPPILPQPEPVDGLTIGEPSPGPTNREQDLWTRYTARLVAAADDGFEIVYPLTEEVVKIGRAAKAGIVLNHPSVTRYHAELFQRNGAWYARDLNSANGTFVDDQLISGEARLEHGRVLRIGQVTLHFYDRPRTLSVTVE
jgi:serine/threonine protein kinase